MMLSGSLVQRKGRGLALASSMKQLMAAWSATRKWNTPRFSRRLASRASRVGSRIAPSPPSLAPGPAPLERASDDGLAARANGNLLVERQAQGKGPAPRGWGMRRAGPADAAQAPLK